MLIKSIIKLMLTKINKDFYPKILVFYPGPKYLILLKMEQIIFLTISISFQKVLKTYNMI